MRLVTDQRILNQLEDDNISPDSMRPVTDNNIIQQLNSSIPDQERSTVSTFLGRMPRPNASLSDSFSSEQRKEILMDVAGAFGGGYALKGAKAALPYVKKGMEYLQPQKYAEQFLQELGGGAKTAEENIEQLSKRMNFARRSSEREALEPKEKLMQRFGKEKFQDSNYLENPLSEEPYGKGLKKVHNSFKEEPTLENNDTLLSKVSKEIRKYQSRQRRGTLDTNGEDRLESLLENKQNLLNDQENLVKNLPQEYQDLYNTFRVKWSRNVGPYEELGSAIRKLSKGKSAGVKSSQVSTKFSFPSEETKQIISQIGPSGKGNILLNRLLSKNPEELGTAIREAKTKGGYQQYITPQMEKISKELEKRHKIREIAEHVGAGVGGYLGGSALGHPLIGLMVGLGAKGGKSLLSKYLEKGYKK